MDLSMTKEMYFEMCETLGSEPIEEEIPPEFEDLSIQTQEVLQIFEYLPDKWNSMSGTYDGKDLTAVHTIYKLFNIRKTNWLLYTDLLNLIISEKITSINRKIKQKGVAKSGKNNSKRVQNTS